MTDEVKPAPYPANTLAKGWRFELNMEQVKKSDTWLRARTGMVRASLLLLWAEAWEQTPCGSLPNDDELLCLLLDMEPEVFAKHKPILLRGWWLADDGRLYHETITARVLDMLKARAANAKRVANHKAKHSDKRSGNALPDGEQQAANAGSNDTRTRTSTGIDTEDFNGPQGAGGREAGGTPVEDDDSPWGDEPPPPDAPPAGAEDGAGLPEATATVYGLIARELRRNGIDANPANIKFRALVDSGADALEFLAYADKAKKEASGNVFAYLVGTVANERKRAKEMAGALHQGRMPAAASPAASKADALMASNIAAAQRFLAKEQHGA